MSFEDYKKTPAYEAQKTLERMANECSVDYQLWNNHTNAVLDLVEDWIKKEAEIERLKRLND